MTLAPSPGFFPQLFPFHLVVDERLLIRQLGPALQRLLGPQAQGQPLAEHVDWHRPRLQPADLKRLDGLADKLCVLALRRLPLQLKGQVLVDQGHGFFLGNPVVQSVEQLRAAGIRLSDIPRHDALGDALVMLQTKNMTIADLVRRRTEELERLASRDALTGVGNRHSFNLDLQSTLEDHRQARRSCALLLLDVDHFKAFNDGHGHLAGDDCLIAVAGRLGEQAGRGDDRVYRYGGEEFALLLPDTPAAGACAVADRIVRHFAETPLWIPHTGHWHTVTVSVGVAWFDPLAEPADQELALIDRADRALYQAKRAGRSRYVCLPQASPGPTR